MQTPVILQTAVILSEADGSRSEPSAKSKDPLPPCATTSSTGSFNYALAVRTGNWPLGTGN
jgi:hypothetical protein